MSGFPIVDLILGIFFVYFLLSIIVSSAVEIILTYSKARATLLKEWLLTALHKKFEKGDNKGISLGQAIMDHSAITGLTDCGSSPAYIKAKDFASALLEKISFDPGNPTKVAKNIEEYIEVINNTELLPNDLKRVMLSYAYEIQNRVEEGIARNVSKLEMFSTKIENWYDSSMQRLTGELKRRYSIRITAVAAVVLTISLNADSIALAKYLYSNTEVRTRLAMAAYNAGQDSALVKKVDGMRITATDSSGTIQNADSIKMEIKKKIEEIEEAKKGLADVMPLTWKKGELSEKGRFSFYLLFAKIAGLLATILAIMMGAPFWFDLINKVSNLRGSGRKPGNGSGETDK